MTILYLLVPLGLAMGLVGLVAFFWSLRAGQYEDLLGASHRILRDEDGPPRPRDTSRPTMVRRSGKEAGR